MNTNPNRNSRQHHQQLPNQGGTAGGGNNSNVLVYINQQQQQAGVDLGGLNNISQNSNPMPPSGWVKSHSTSHHLGQQGNGISSSNSNCSPSPLSAGSMSAPYGASNSFNSQHQFYSSQSRQQQQTDVRYSAGNTAGTNHMRPNPNYNNLSANNGMFYPVETQSNAESCQYYQQENSFQFDHNQMKSNSCDMSSGSDGVSSNNSNFYGFYPQNSHSYQQQDYQNQMEGASSGSTNMGDDTDYSRVLHQQHYHNSHHHQQQHSNVQNPQGHNNSLPVSVQDYFGLPSSSTENSSGRHNPNYGHQLHHQHHQSTPFRRNSIESYSSEPGDLPYNAKYACNFPSTQFNSQANSGMTKRDSMSNMSMSVPNCNSQWSRDNIVSGPVEQCHTGNSHGYFFNSHSQQNQSHRHFSNVNVNQNNLNSNFQQQQMQSFKSCSFEQQEPRLEDMKPDGQVSTVGTSTKAAAVKHRSLSLSLPSSSYSRSDIGFHSQLHDQEDNLVHSHLNNSNNLSINPFDEIESTSNVVPVPVNQNSDHTSQCKLGNCVSRVDSISGERTSIQCDNFSQNSIAEARIQQIQEEIVESQNLVETTTLNSCPSSQSNFSNSEVSNSDSIVSACSNFPEVVTSVLDTSTCKIDGMSRDDGSKTDVSLISTTTNDIGNHVDNESETDPNNSSSSCGLGLFGHSNSVSNLTLIVGDSDDSESCMSGISSFSGSNNNKISPQKISKRSFSEADKDLVINTTAVSFGGRGTVIIPKGWKRESSSSQQMENIIFYVSPSGTKLRTWDELKNYICSDGTCKCGLSCPLRLEHAFSFDPKVTNLCQEEEESLLNLNETGTETRLLCNHKRKIPKSEDSPLISSTRDDLGDCGEKKSKKRRTSGSGDVNENLTSISLPKSSPSITSGHHVPVPFSQQSPDTTTQTPQTDMSPASSVSSEPSSAAIFSSAGGNGGSRSTNSTPTPTSSASSSRNVCTPPGKGQAQCGFAWPPPPTSQAQSAPFWSTTIINNSNGGSNTIGNSTAKKNSNAPAKKSGYQHHLIPKVVKRSASPCPNIDVRQIPLEQNRPPPRQTTISVRNPPAAGASHPNQNPNLSFFPITSSHGDEINLNTINMNMNTGYSISPIPNTTNNVNTLQFAQTIVNANVNTITGNTLPIQIQRVMTGITPCQTTNALLPQALPSSITISMVNQQPQQQQQPTTTTRVNSNASTAQNVATSSESVSEKSPLQLVQDVVNRFHSNPKAEEGNNAAKEIANGSSETTTNTTNVNRKETPTTSSSPVVSSTPNEPSTTPNEVEKSELEIQIPATSSSVTSTNTVNKTKTKSDDDSISIITTSVGNKTNGAVSFVEVTNSSEAKSVAASPSLSSACATIISGIPLLSNSTTLTTTTSSTGTVPIMTAMCVASTATNTIINCATTTTASNTNTLTLNALSNLSAISAAGTNQPLILQQSTDQTNGQNSTFLTATSGHQPLRYPFFQTIQPFFLNSTGAPGGSLIISPQSQPQTDTIGQQSFIYDQSHTQQTTTDGMQSMLQQTTMVLDPNVCGNTGGIVGGPKKKKKRLSKKQQQQQVQLQLQQQLLLQQLHQQAQQQQAATIPLTIFPQSFNLSHQGFSLQPMNMNMNMNMNFFPTPTILTLPNLILNPADGTLFIQPSTPMSQQQTVKLGQFPLAAAPQQSVQQPNLIAPKKDIITTTASTTTLLSSDMLKSSPTSGDIGSDDSRQNATPDSSTNDMQLNLSVTNPTQQNSITLSLQPHTTIGTTASHKKIAVKSKAVSSSSSAVKRVFTQKQILPKIDSTTPNVENG